MGLIRKPFALLILVAALVGCSASPSVSPSAVESSTAAALPSPTTENGATALIDAVEATFAEGTVRIGQTIEFVGSSVIPDGTSGSAGGQASLEEPPQLRLQADFTEFNVGELVMIRDDNLLYMKGDVIQPMVGRGRWLLVDLESNAPAAAPFKSLASGQNDISMALYYLYGITGDVDASDGETIGGQPTTHYEMEIDLEGARDTIPEERAEALEDLIASLRTGGIDRSLDGEVWVGADGIVQRLRYTYRLGPEQGMGALTTVIDFSDFGAPLDLGIPRDDDVVPVEDAAPQ